MEPKDSTSEDDQRQIKTTTLQPDYQATRGFVVFVHAKARIGQSRIPVALHVAVSATASLIISQGREIWKEKFRSLYKQACRDIQDSGDE
ncbi:hypothetical protein AC249_AIPGENE18812 [Exaiptasia diaphana]|nr:hypothetical protein AC249_AIPGENE18812 [Exaiptasia diaphana]